MKELDYLKRTEPLYFRNPDYDKSRAYDVVHCGTCGKSEIEPEINECECQQDVCPFCAGTSPGYHEICRRGVDGEIDPMLDRKAYALGLADSSALQGMAATAWFPYFSGNGRNPVLGSPGVGEWCLWSVVTKHGREYYSGARLDDRLIYCNGFTFNIDVNVYWARVVMMPAG